MTIDELTNLQVEAPKGAITSNNLKKLFGKRTRTTVYVGVTERQNDRIWKMDILPKKGLNSLGYTIVFHYPENLHGGMCFALEGEHAKSRHGHGWVFLNYWHAYAHMLRVLAKKP